MGDEHVEFLEAAFVHQQFDALARRQLSATMLGVDAPLSAAQTGLAATALKLLQNVGHESPLDVIRPR